MSQRFLSNIAKNLIPYVPGEQPKDKKYIKLNTNENPYPPSEKVSQAISRELGDLKLYPDPEATLFRDSTAKFYNESLGLKGAEQLDRDNIFVGNGSDEVLAFIFPAFFQEKKIAFASITYSFYPVYANFFQVDVQEIPLGKSFELNPEDYITGLDSDVSGILICNPNAPTGRAVELEQIQRILEANPDRLVVVDEAYVDFGGQTTIGFVNQYDNLLVAQTLSKSRSLAGLRVGFAIGCKGLIEAINRVKNSFNSYTADRLAIVGGTAAMEDREYFEQCREKIKSTRERVVSILEEMGFSVLPSKTNFIFITHNSIPAEELFLGLREKGILVRYFKKPLIDNYLRVSIGTDEEMDSFLATLRELI